MSVRAMVAATTSTTRTTAAVRTSRCKVVMFGRWLASCAKPSTLAHYQYMLAKSGVPKTHGEACLPGMSRRRSVTGPPRESPRARSRDVLAAIHARIRRPGTTNPRPA